MVLNQTERVDIMRVKAICDLNQLSDNELFKAVSEGMSLIIENSINIYSGARIVIKIDSPRGYQILRNVASEEAAKFMILLDAIRCERPNSDQFSKQLKRYNDHLAKGIYAEYYEIKPANFKEVKNWVDNERKEYYLDGPNDVDWIFHNWTLQQREERIYVDYMENDGNHQWLSPQNYDDLLESRLSFELVPEVIPLSTALYSLGFSKPEALKVVAEKWRPIKMNDHFSWQDIRQLNKETLEELENNQLLENVNEAVKRNIIDKWLFPIYSIDLRIVKVDKEKLREIQENWSPW